MSTNTDKLCLDRVFRMDILGKRKLPDVELSDDDLTALGSLNSRVRKKFQIEKNQVWLCVGGDTDILFFSDTAVFTTTRKLLKLAIVISRSL